MNIQSFKLTLRTAALSVLVLLGGLSFSTAKAQTTVNMAQTPLLALKSAPGLVMLTMSRDHRLYYSAYNDVTDIDGDGAIDVGFKPNITYYGYFVSDRCYKYSATPTPARYVPVAIADPALGCSGQVAANRWHGNWLNWALTSRMDALRKVLYGGYRTVDAANSTVLEAANIPGDSHVWGKEFRPTSRGGPDSYLIQNYTPLSAPTGTSTMHIFLVKSEGDASTVYQNRQVPTLRVVQNVDAVIDRVWIWSSSERPIGGANGSFGYNRPAARVVGGLPGYQSGGTAYAASNFPAAFTMSVRVEACVGLGTPVAREAGCTGYPASPAAATSWKPTGVLHEYSKDDALKFGLITGSYQNHYSGGVVRKDISSFSDEVLTTTGVFTALNGIANGINKLTTYGYSGDANYTYDCGFMFDRLRTQDPIGTTPPCRMWGAPVAEMMFEGLRYFGGKQPTDAFITGVSAAASPDTRLGLPLVSTWKNPYRTKANGGSPICSRPVQMVIADPITSFDSDQLPGSSFPISLGNGAALPTGAGALNALGSLDVTTEADRIWTKEHLGTTTITTSSGTSTYPAGTMFGSSDRFFFGQTSLTNADGNPTGKAATTFATMRGHGPDETNTQGSYYAASVAKYGRERGVDVTDGISGGARQANKVDQISVALGSVVPRIEFKYSPSAAIGTKTISILPFSKSVGPAGNGIATTIGSFQPTGLITLVYFDKIYNTSPANISATFNGGRPYMRFMASFSDMDQGGDNEADANNYYTVYVDATNQVVVQTDWYYQAGGIKQNMGYIISGTTKDGVYLEVGDEANNPIYYLDTLAGQDPAPAGGRLIPNTTSLPATAIRSFTFGGGGGATFVPKDPLWYAAKYGGAGVFDINGDPTNYFKITNPADLPTQMGKAFKGAAALAAVASTSVVGAGQRSVGATAVYQANYDSLTWSSRIYAFAVATNGSVSNTPTWEVSTKIPAPASRANLYLGRGGTTTPYALTSTGFSGLTTAEKTDFGTTTYSYLLGDKSGEERKGGLFRNRGTTAGTEYGSVLGDIVNSDPQVISKKDYGYTASDTTYTTYLNSITSEMLAVGSNDGFFHVFDAQPDATGGGELLGFMPQAARTNIKDLASRDYKHRNFVDGPIGLGHAKIAVPGDSTTAWRTVAVVGGGDGVQTVFAVNVSTKTFTANSILWEMNTTTLTASASTHLNKFGNIMGRPAIGKLRDGTWVAIFGNGYNSTAGTSHLFVVKLSDGTIVRVIGTNATTGNGLGAVEAVLKTTGNQDTIDYVYGADYQGHIWRFDPNANTAGTLIYKTPNGRPITAEIKVDAAPVSPLTTGGKMIYFGTGSYLSATDPATTSTQAFYGIYDNLVYALNTPAFAVEADLSAMTIGATAGGDVRTTSVAATPTWYTVAGKKGWKVDLTGANVQLGERVIAPPIRYKVAGVTDAFIFTSVVPGTDDCEPGLDSWITGVNALTGGYEKVFKSNTPNSVRVKGGSPRGVFVLDDGGRPFLYTSQTIFGETVPTTTFLSGVGGDQTVSINGVLGRTRILYIELNTAESLVPSPINLKQVWRQLK
jgi:type IV pilus assembly protein PilY1